MAPPENPNFIDTVVLAIAYIFGMAPISLVLGLSKRLSSTTDVSFTRAIDSIEWSQPASMYVGDLPRAVTDELEHLRRGLTFERAVEGHLITPRWYQRQAAAVEYARYISAEIVTLIDTIASYFVEEAESLRSAGRHTVASQVIQAGLEASEKLRFHFNEFRSCLERLKAFHRVSDVPWPSVEWETLEQRIHRLRERLIMTLSDIAVNLASRARTPDLPDYFGQAYTLLAQETYAAMATENEDLFRKLFPAFFLAGLSAHDRIRKEFQERDQLTQVAYSAEPIVDLLDLSGFAIIYSELDGRSYWEIARELWDRYLGGMPDPKKLIQFVSGIIEYRRSFFAILPRDLARTAWRQDFERRLRERGLLVEPFERYVTRETRPTHASPMIRALARSGHMFTEPSDVFIIQYLTKRPEAEELGLSRSAESLAQALERERSRQQTEDEV